MLIPITASKLHDIETCLQRASMDHHGDIKSLEEMSAFAGSQGPIGVINDYGATAHLAHSHFAALDALGTRQAPLLIIEGAY